MATRILPAARARLIEIWSYTEARWDDTQADRYVNDLVAAIERHGTDFNRWRSLKDVELPGVFVLRHASHFIFFRNLGEGDIGVISILHESMDLPARLREDLG